MDISIASRLDCGISTTTNGRKRTFKRGRTDMILPSTQETPEIEREFEIGFATTKNHAGYFSLRATIPRALLAKIGEPARIAVTGTPHEGYTIAATRSKESGTYAVNYAVSARTVPLALPFKPSKLTKVERLRVAVSAKVKDGRIRISGMPREWIDGVSPWVEGAAPPAHHRLTAKPGTGTLAIEVANGASVNGHADPTAPVAKSDIKIGADVPTDQLKQRLAYTLRMAAAMKAELEKRTGLKLRITRDFYVLVDLD
jgi:hypothetical protein